MNPTREVSSFRRRYLARNATCFIVPQLLWGVAWALVWDGPMPATLVKALGRDSSLVGTAQLLIGIGLSSGMFLSAYVLAPRHGKRGLVYLSHTVCALVLALLAFVFYAIDAAQHGELLAAIYLTLVFTYFLSIGIAIPVWLSIVGDLFSEAHRSRLLAVSFMANRMGGIAGGWWAEHTLRSHENVPATWSLLLLAAAICGGIGSVPFLGLAERERMPTPRPRLRHHAGQLISVFRKCRAIRRFVLVDLLGVASFIVIVYFGDAALRRDGLEEAWSGRFVQYAAVGQLVICGAIALIGHVMPLRRWLELSLLLMVAAALISAHGGGSLPHSIVAVLGGIFMGIRLSAHSPEVMRLNREVEDQTLALSAVGTAITAMQGAMPFLGGLALAFCTYASLFYVVAFLVLLAAVLLMTWVPAHGQQGTSGAQASSSRG